MSVDKTMALVEQLSDLYRKYTLCNFDSKVQGEPPKYGDILGKAKHVAGQLNDSGLFEFDFSSDSAFVESLHKFVNI